MRKFYTLAMAMLTMAAVMISCSSDDGAEEKTPEPEPEPVIVKYNLSFLMPATDQQLEVMDLSLNFTIDDKPTSLTPDKMQTVSCPKVEAECKNLGMKATPIFFTYDVPGEFTVEQLKNGTIERIAKRNEEGLAKYMNDTLYWFPDVHASVRVAGTEKQSVDATILYHPTATPLTSNTFINAVFDYMDLIGEKSPIVVAGD